MLNFVLGLLEELEGLRREVAELRRRLVLQELGDLEDEDVEPERRGERLLN